MNDKIDYDFIYDVRRMAIAELDRYGVRTDLLKLDLRSEKEVNDLLSGIRKLWNEHLVGDIQP